MHNRKNTKLKKGQNFTSFQNLMAIDFLKKSNDGKSYKILEKNSILNVQA